MLQIEEVRLRVGWPLAFLFLVVAAHACSGGGGASDTREIVPVDVILIGGDDIPPVDIQWPQPDLALDLGSDGLPADQTGKDHTGDGLADVAAQDQAHADGLELPHPLDVPPAPDVPQLPDIPADLGFVDAGPCGTCPVETPKCQEGVCVCTGESCSVAFYCKGGQCMACSVDAHCGMECESCSSQGKYCDPVQFKCVGCDDAHPCQPGKSCVDAACVTCEDLGLCGPECVECPATTPDCLADICVCNETSCGAAAVCEGGACVACGPSDPAHCGADCLVCAGDAPHCLDGGCIFCNADAQCGPACEACGGETPLCRPDGVGCVACLADADCQNGDLCTDYSCIPDCQASGCQTDLNDGGKKCSEAFVIGRPEASGIFHHEGDTYGDNNDDDLNYVFEHPECWDASYDHFFRIYLMPGDTIAVNLIPKDNFFDAMLKLYTGTMCDDDDAGLFQSNATYIIQCWNDESDGDPEFFTHAVSEEGWYTIVVDGRQSGDEEDWGEYGIDITLTCSQENCCCP